MGFNFHKATKPLQGDTSFFTTKFLEIPGIYSFDQPWKDERLSRPWAHLVVLNMGLLDWGSSALSTRPLWRFTGKYDF